MTEKMSFGAIPTMREVLPGQHAILKLGEFDKWEIIETEFGEKFKLRVQLFSHTSHDPIPKTGIWMDWVSKAKVCKDLYTYFYTEENEMKVFDTNIPKEFAGKWKLERYETGTYRIISE